MDARLDTLVLRVEEMDCEGCERRVVNVLRRLDGVRGAVADHLTGRVQVDFTGAGVEPRVLAERIGRAGYQVTTTGAAAEPAQAVDASASGDSA